MSMVALETQKTDFYLFLKNVNMYYSTITCTTINGYCHRKRPYSQYWLIRPKIRDDFLSNLPMLLTREVTGVCPEEMVELSGLIELPVVELTDADCIQILMHMRERAIYTSLQQFKFKIVKISHDNIDSRTVEMF